MSNFIGKFQLPNLITTASIFITLFNMGSSQTIDGFSYLPRQDYALNGNVGQYEFYVSTDGINWGSPVAKGAFITSHDAKIVSFPATTGQSIRFRGLTDTVSATYMSVAELGVNVVSEPTP